MLVAQTRFLRHGSGQRLCLKLQRPRLASDLLWQHVPNYVGAKPIWIAGLGLEICLYSFTSACTHAVGHRCSGYVLRYHVLGHVDVDYGRV